MPTISVSHFRQCRWWRKLIPWMTVRVSPILLQYFLVPLKWQVYHTKSQSPGDRSVLQALPLSVPQSFKAQYDALASTCCFTALGNIMIKATPGYVGK